MSARERYRELCAKVDAFFSRVKARHGGEMQCAPGCHGCCRAGLTVTSVEADEIRDALAASPPRSHPRAAGGGCPALEEDGRCAIYPVRPLVCRSHGVPVRMASPRGLPVVTSCELNFTALGPAAADADCVLDQATLSLTLGALARAHAAETGGDPAARFALADLLRET